MNSATFLSALFLLVGAAYGKSGPEWNGLRVTWSMNPFSKWGFNGLPRHINELTPEFKLVDQQCNKANAKFLGQRYRYNDDAAVTLLFDGNGTIAGIQTSAPKKTLNPPAPVANHQYVDDGENWTLTAYFVDPSTICTEARSQELLQSEGTGTGLWLQMGPNPVHDSVHIPATEDEVKQTKWTKGHCFLTMGNHYWYNISKEMNCDNFLPYCLMYNGGKLTAFCFSMNAELTSPRFEHPPPGSASMFINPVPECFAKRPEFQKPSTMHVYFKDNARLSSWC